MAHRPHNVAKNYSSYLQSLPHVIFYITRHKNCFPPERGSQGAGVEKPEHEKIIHNFIKNQLQISNKENTLKSPKNPPTFSTRSSQRLAPAEFEVYPEALLPDKNWEAKTLEDEAERNLFTDR